MNTEDVIANKTLTVDRFTREIEALVNRHNLEYIDAVVHYCDKHHIEVESVASLIKSNSKIKSKIQHEAEDLNFLPKSTRLPV